jgi:hypothetical protein|tara:strand:- start:745 stop:1134 length:390 start_codon:yes stop_codon:yes gene_type:complete
MACPSKYVSLIKLGLYLLLNPHALHTFNQIGADSTIEDAKAALGWIQKESVAVFKRSDCHRALHGRFPKVNRLVEALDVLRGWNAVEGPEKVKSPSNRSSQIYRVNPALIGFIERLDQLNKFIPRVAFQ